MTQPNPDADEPPNVFRRAAGRFRASRLLAAAAPWLTWLVEAGTQGYPAETKRRLMILYGGVGRDGMLSDTWSWDGREWKRLADTGPEARAMGYLAYDRHRDRIVLFGGRRKGWPNGDADDTWEWDGTRWSRVAADGR